MIKVTTMIRRAATIAAITLGCAAAGMGVASADTAEPLTAPAPMVADTSCLQEGLEALLADPVGTVLAAVGDPLGTAGAELACLREVLGI